MNKKNDGGQAFPRSMSNMGGEHSPYGPDGMTLRDWFAGQALAGLIASSRTHGKWIDEEEYKIFAADAYNQADAMLKAREN